MQLLFYLAYYHSTCFGHGSCPSSGVIHKTVKAATVSETCRVIINQVKQKLHLVGYLPIRYYKDAR